MHSEVQEPKLPNHPLLIVQSSHSLHVSGSVQNTAWFRGLIQQTLRVWFHHLTSGVTQNLTLGVRVTHQLALGVRVGVRGWRLVAHVEPIHG